MATIALRMNEDVKKVLAMDDMREKMEQFGAENGGGSMEKFAAFIQAEQKSGFWSQAKPRLKLTLEWFCRVLGQKDAFPHNLRTCSRSSKQKCHESEMDELQTGIEMSLAVLP